ncbi:MAG: hypothetical protein ACWA5R_14260 [bacterium]
MNKSFKAHFTFGLLLIACIPCYGEGFVAYTVIDNPENSILIFNSIERYATSHRVRGTHSCGVDEKGIWPNSSCN